MRLAGDVKQFRESRTDLSQIDGSPLEELSSKGHHSTGDHFVVAYSILYGPFRKRPNRHSTARGNNLKAIR